MGSPIHENGRTENGERRSIHFRKIPFGNLEFTINRVRDLRNSATKEHLLLYDHSFDSDDGSMLPIKNNKNKITSIDSFIYKRDQALLNKSNHFLQLKIFAE